MKGKGVVEKDFGSRTNRTDYRKQACVSMRQFEEILIRSIVFYNSQRTLESYPYTNEMIDADIKPTASAIWNFKKNDLGTNLITVDAGQLSLVLLPRVKGKFTREGLKVNKLRYVHTAGSYIDRYLDGGEVTAAYSPDNVSRVWLLEDGDYREFRLIESRYKDMPIQSVEELKERTRILLKNNEEDKLQGQIDLSNYIRDIASVKYNGERSINGIRENRQKETVRKHMEIGGEIK